MTHPAGLGRAAAGTRNAAAPAAVVAVFWGAAARRGSGRAPRGSAPPAGGVPHPRREVGAHGAGCRSLLAPPWAWPFRSRPAATGKSEGGGRENRRPPSKPGSDRPSTFSAGPPPRPHGDGWSSAAGPQSRSCRAPRGRPRGARTHRGAVGSRGHRPACSSRSTTRPPSQNSALRPGEDTRTGTRGRGPGAAPTPAGAAAPSPRASPEGTPRAAPPRDLLPATPPRTARRRRGRAPGGAHRALAVGPHVQHRAPALPPGHGPAATAAPRRRPRAYIRPRPRTRPRPVATPNPLATPTCVLATPLAPLMCRGAAPGGTGTGQGGLSRAKMSQNVPN